MNELTPFIERYYPGWFSYARYICSCYSIRNDAEDIVGEVMEVLCHKPAPVLDDLLQHELAGEPKLRNYVKKIIRFRAFSARKIHKRTISIDDYVLAQIDDSEVPISSDEMREKEALLREDSFISSGPAKRIQQIKGSVCVVIVDKYPRYFAIISQGKSRIQKTFTTRHAAFEFLMSMSS